MDFLRLQYFMAVAQAQSYSKAAAALNLSQPTLSRQVQLLEAELGQPLLERHGRGVRLTESGKAMLAHGRSISAAVDAAKADMADRLQSPRGKVRLGLPPLVASLITPDVVQQFLQACPDASIIVEESLSIRLREWLLADRLDVAVLFDPSPTPQLLTEPLTREPLVLISTRPLPERVKVAQLVDYPLVLPSRPQALRMIFDDAVEDQQLPLRIVAEVDSIKMVLSLVARNVGCSVVPASAVKTWPGSAPVFTAQVSHPVIRNRIVLATPAARPHNRLVKAVHGILKPLMKQHFSA
ncbi:MAG: LysR family transcriptional regulator [Comamonas sp.]|jgi:LysR family nitrogen assimilation transcriptional regulator|uniref:LysR family transcriptional regulator n=1 Tax=Comamonas koreensis TaxID=160825 RepID=A0AAW4Y3A1_9BURK|nr:LysR family transcriptional regulator [Comamonas koreensis]MCD2168015.1 LysR family transcriptional regulator [Comamonas koreensis]MDR2330451.1 LysR family transcriptional regulator [Comamonas sp.]